MTYEKLIKQDRIKAYDASEMEIQRLLEIASRDLSTAESMIDVNPDWAYNISYNAMLQSSRAFMLRKGFRPRGPSQHATVVQFVKHTLGEEHRNFVSFFDQMRRKRNRLVYDTAKDTNRDCNNPNLYFEQSGNEDNFCARFETKAS